MTRRGVIRLLTGLASATVLGGCFRGPSAKYRFKMTIEVDTPIGRRNASSAYEVRAWYEQGLDPSGKVRRCDVRGEALAVELPGGKPLLALLKTTNETRDDLALMSMAALDPAYHNDWVESATRIATGQHLRSPSQVKQSDYPLLVTFIEISDPRTVKRVDPQDMAATFGAGVRIRGITVEITDDPVTTGIENRLRWLPAMRGGPFPKRHPGAAGPPFGMQGIYFSTELSR